MNKLFNVSLFILLFSNYFSYAQTWQKVNDLDSSSVCTLNSFNNYIYAGTTNGKIYISSNNGLNWNKTNASFTNYLILGILNYHDKLFVVCDKGLFISSDNGQNWYKNAPPDSGYISKIFNFKDVLYICDSYNHILFSSTDDGNNWAKIGNTPGINGKEIASKNDTLFFGAEGGIYLSLDSGKTWILFKKTHDPEAYCTNIYFNDNYFYFIGRGYGYGIFYESTDYGTSWIIDEHTDYPTGITNYYNVLITSSGNKGMFYSKDNGASWISINAGLHNLDIWSICLINNTLYCAPDSSGIYKLDLGFLGVQDTPENTKQLSICPNPVSDILTISNLPNDFNYNTIIEIYNIYGLKVIEIPYTDKIDVSKLSAGVYYLKINSKYKELLTQKFIKL